MEHNSGPWSSFHTGSGPTSRRPVGIYAAQLCEVLDEFHPPTSITLSSKTLALLTMQMFGQISIILVLVASVENVVAIPVPDDSWVKLMFLDLVLRLAVVFSFQMGGRGLLTRSGRRGRSIPHCGVVVRTMRGCGYPLTRAGISDLYTNSPSLCLVFFLLLECSTSIQVLTRQLGRLLS